MENKFWKKKSAFFQKNSFIYWMTPAYENKE